MTNQHSELNSDQIDEILNSFRTRVDQHLFQLFSIDQADAGRLIEAMRDAVTSGGKRVRPILVYATAKALNIPFEQVDNAAAALEIIHAYSLVHDDLPAMDDDDLRRGQPTCHIKFGEATAILAGDALQAYAFSLLAKPVENISAKNQLALLQMISDASGHKGMAFGQAIDLAALGQSLSLQELEYMHRHKTGALICASVSAATFCTNTLDEDLRSRLLSYAEAIGLAFQIVDDILDVTADTDTLGKTQGSDIARDKPTYPSLLGLEGARQHADDTLSKALESLEGLPERFDILRHIARYIVQRSY